MQINRKVIQPVNPAISQISETTLSSIFPKISEGAYDLLRETNILNILMPKINQSRGSGYSLVNSIQMLYRSLTLGHSPVSISQIDKYLSFLQSSGTKISRDCPSTIYYPLGGFDVHTPAAMFPGVKDIVSVGMDSFGVPKDICSFISENESIESVTRLLTTGFDHTGKDFYYSFLNRKELGKGSIAIIRIPHHLNGELKGVNFFTLSENGELNFFDSKKVVKLSTIKNLSAVIEFEIPNQGRKRFWYISQDLRENSLGFQAFINNLQFQTLFLKGHIELYEREGALNFDNYKRYIAGPARNNNSKVVSDSTNICPLKEPSFWKVEPSRILIDQKEKFLPFGYSNNYGCIFYGSANDLAF